VQCVRSIVDMVAVVYRSVEFLKKGTPCYTAYGVNV